jgi:recombination protein RecA
MNEIDRKKKSVNKALDEYAKKSKRSINAEFGNLIEPEFIKTPFPTANTLLGGGFPKGKFGVVGGPAATAKTTLLLQTIAHNQAIDPEFVALWTDAEDALDKPWCIRLGVDLDRLIIQKYDENEEFAFAEELLEQGLRLMEAHAIDMWVIDSLGALIPKAEVMKTLEENAMLDLQRKLPIFFRRGIVSIAPKPAEKWNGTSVIFIGQVYTVPSARVSFDEIKGGNGVKHWAHWRLKTRRGNRDEGPGNAKVMAPDGESRDVALGWAQHLKLDKSKQNEKEGQEVILQFVHGRGLDSEMCAITALFAHDIFAKGGGGWYTHEDFPGDNRIRGKESVIEFLKKNKEICNDLISQLDNQFAESTVVEEAPINNENEN